jgi:hypothetical protein
VNFSGFSVERGRLMTPTEVETSRPVTVIGWQTADRLFGTEIDPLEPSSRTPFPRCPKPWTTRLSP